MVAWLAIVLTGYGAVDAPRQYIAYFLRPVRREDIERAERQLMMTYERLVRRRKRLALARARLSNDDVPSLTAECRSLAALAAATFVDVDALRAEASRVRFARTARGRIYNLLGYAFAAYCSYKIVMSVVNIVLDRHARKDPVTIGLEWALFLLNIEIDVQFWSQSVSFALVGAIIVSSIRGFLQRVTKLFHAYGSPASARLIVFFIAELMGMYLISSVLLMRMNLPQQYRLVVTQALGDIQFSFFHRWFDFIFLSVSPQLLFFFLIVVRISSYIFFLSLFFFFFFFFFLLFCYFCFHFNV